MCLSKHFCILQTFKQLLFLGETKGLWQDCLNLNETLDDTATLSPPEAQNGTNVTTDTNVTSNVTAAPVATVTVASTEAPTESENDTSEGSGIGR